MLDEIYEAIDRVINGLVYILKIILFIATIPLVFIYLHYRYKVEKKLREQGKLWI